MKKVTVDLEKLKWPNKCAACNGSATRVLTVDSKETKAVVPFGAGVVTIGKVTRIRYPVCNRHFLSGWFASGLSQRSLFYLMLGVLSMFTALAASLAIYRITGNLLHGKETEDFPYGSVTYTTLYWGLFFWARSATPVRFAGKTYFGTTFQFNNDEYADSFAKANGRMS
ncbi:hypothetical protein FNU76_03875 [Chitinimonas arctica]|uniref:Uncharacterized protein n=1 Tax=Chitinimonas arctica TaxID=2594795 RepID=A0A516SBW5_9NEIS|nr:hypothetical protein [Chitinimonas arctica]QDQ25558.1 hypothetical protein FNU76_03875 [Chitinimonas arctica]